MAVFRDADPRKNMNHAQIAAAIRRLEASSVTIAGEGLGDLLIQPILHARIAVGLHRL